MKKLVGLLLLLSGCACAVDKGDPSGFSNYISGCWDAAKGEHTTDLHAPPTKGYNETITPIGTVQPKDTVKGRL